MACEALRRPETEPLEKGCPACGSTQMESFYQVHNVPVNSCIMMTSREEALAYPKGEIELRCCHDCGFVFNACFDPKLIEYSTRYEETQGYSDTFNAFHMRLAEELIDRHDLHGKKVLEIGCGKGEFLTLICELGGNQGTGFDPSYVAERSRAPYSEKTTFVTDFYSEKYSDRDADFLCCKMTLEHIPQVDKFVATVRAAVGERENTVVFFQVPEAIIILDDCRFWDVYYEHCSYFNRGALARLFRNCGFQMTKTWVDYDNQYLMIEALPANASQLSSTADDQAALQELLDAVKKFATKVPATVEYWSKIIEECHAADRRIVLWGSGSKAVSFLNMLACSDKIDCVVDINPHRQGMYMPGTGHRIVGPGDLPANPPDTVIIMNPIYRSEISEILAAEGLYPEIMTL
jgi:SAM-dependent methyltransferase